MCWTQDTKKPSDTNGFPGISAAAYLPVRQLRK